MTVTRIELPSGGWVDLCQVDAVPEKYLRRVRNTVFRLSPEVLQTFEAASSDADLSSAAADLASVLTAEDVDLMMEANDLTVSALVVDWSFGDDGKHPTPDRITDLAGGDYRALQEAVAPQAAALMGPDFGPQPGAAETPT